MTESPRAIPLRDHDFNVHSSADPKDTNAEESIQRPSDAEAG